MSTHHEKVYQYKSLPSQSSIRLLRILPGTPSKRCEDKNCCPNGKCCLDIKCSLESFELSEAPVYYALSYTWGDPLDHGLSSSDNHRVMTSGLTKHVMHENGSVIKITQSLLDALDQLSTSLGNSSSSIKTQPYWWIDAICINQFNDPKIERNSQVSMS
jgi:hypothetical protein